FKYNLGRFLRHNQSVKMDVEPQGLKIASFQDHILQLKSSISKNRKTIASLKDRISRSNNTIKKLKIRNKISAKNMAINHYLKFAQNVDMRASDCKADIIVGHGVQSLPACARLHEVNGGKYICDVIETPSFGARASVNKWDPTVLKMVDYAMVGYLSDADALITVGWTLGATLKKYHDDIRVIPNYRKYEKFVTKQTIREEFKIKQTDRLLICISTIASGFEDLLHAMKLLGDTIHLVVIGTLVPASYQSHIVKLIDDLELGAQVHIREPVPYPELLETISIGDLGIIVRDKTITNNYVSLPNRVFDYISAGLPIIAPDIPDIARIIHQYDCGITIEGTSPDDWVQGIRDGLKDQEIYHKNALGAAKICSWQSLEESQLHVAFDNTKSVAFVGFNNISKNNRTMRMATSLVQMGVSVKVIAPMDDTDTLPDGVEKVSVRLG
ncbi:glycosyltransferase family 4 protein, partial [Tateyamaria sp.]|nr:glycosyltransferase family 4 protein [Tateyamaria sp.]